MIATETSTEATLALVTRFENGFNTRDVDALMADMTDIVEIIATGDRAICRFVMRWKAEDGSDAALHGVDVITVRDGKIAEKLTYGTM
jgi:ketosteroid isomerase-like protein